MHLQLDMRCYGLQATPFQIAASRIELLPREPFETSALVTNDSCTNERAACSVDVPASAALHSVSFQVSRGQSRQVVQSRPLRPFLLRHLAKEVCKLVSTAEDVSFILF